MLEYTVAEGIVARGGETTHQDGLIVWSRIAACPYELALRLYILHRSTLSYLSIHGRSRAKATIIFQRLVYTLSHRIPRSVSIAVVESV